jgi:hypothetical protein
MFRMLVGLGACIFVSGCVCAMDGDNCREPVSGLSNTLPETMTSQEQTGRSVPEAPSATREDPEHDSARTPCAEDSIDASLEARLASISDEEWARIFRDTPWIGD